MAEDDEFGSGVRDVFAALASKRKDEPASAAPTPSKRPPTSSVPAAQTTSPNDQPTAERPVARTGRFPGAKNGPRKEKVTARISPELKDAFVNWSLDDRSPLQDLFERALTEFYQRHRASSENSK